MPFDLTNTFHSFGVDVRTGKPLPDPTVDDSDPVAADKETDERLRRRRFAAIAFGVVVGINEEKLSEAGWGVLFAEDDPNAAEIEKALAPLLQHRAAEAGPLFKIFKGSAGRRANETAVDWLARQKNGVGLDLVDPQMGVPYYLLLIGSPDVIPNDFQYRLDIYWAVGRLHFDKVDEYAAYAKSVVDYEKAATVKRQRRAAIFAPRHEFDAATSLFHEHVASSLAALTPLNKFKWDLLLAENAHKKNLNDLLTGNHSNGLPALLFSGGHGMEVPKDDATQKDIQGALVCQDWGGLGSISKEQWYAASDVPADANLHGLIYLLFACYGGGYSRLDTFRDHNGIAHQIANQDAYTALPRAMLSHKNGGALAVIAHVDRAFAYSFMTTSGAKQVQGFREVLFSLMLGRRVGSALDRFNGRWAAIATELSDLMRDDPDHNKSTKALNLWIARDDARNYIILGDPAVRLGEERLLA